MSLFHLHARLLEGPASNPRRDELQSAETDDWDEINDLARELVARGFTVWIYDHGHKSPLPGASDYRVVASLGPDRPAPPGGNPPYPPLISRRIQPGSPRRWTRRIPPPSNSWRPILTTWADRTTPPVESAWPRRMRA